MAEHTEVWYRLKSCWKGLEVDYHELLQSLHSHHCSCHSQTRGVVGSWAWIKAWGVLYRLAM